MSGGFTPQARHKSGTATMLSAGSTASFDLGVQPFRVAHFRVPSLSTNAEIGLEGSFDGSTWSKVNVKSATANHGQYLLVSGVTGWFQIATPTRHIRFHASAAVDDGAAFEVVAFD